MLKTIFFGFLLLYFLVSVAGKIGRLMNKISATFNGISDKKETQTTQTTSKKSSQSLIKGGDYID
jgi:hypothetical protein